MTGTRCECPYQGYDPSSTKSHRTFAFAFFTAFLLFSGMTASAQTWTGLGVSMGTYVKEVVVDPVTPTTLYSGAVHDSSHPIEGVYKSTDGGSTWNFASSGIPTGIPGINGESGIY